MPISKTRLLERQQDLKNQLEHAKQQFVALTGALADIEFLLNEEAASALTQPIEEVK